MPDIGSRLWGLVPAVLNFRVMLPYLRVRTRVFFIFFSKVTTVSSWAGIA